MISRCVTCGRTPTSSAPIVIVENADEKEEVPTTLKELSVPDGIPKQEEKKNDVAQSLIKGPEPAARTAVIPSTPPDVDVMEAPSINSRQPPDGHEFPDYQETPIVSKPIMSEPPAKAKTHAPSLRNNQKTSNNVRSMIAKFSNSQDSSSNIPDGEANEAISKKALSKSVININDATQSSLKSYNFPTMPNSNSHSINRMSLDISISANTQILPEKKNDLAHPRLHMRSQSLIDISEKKSQDTDPWNLLVEQRRRGLSKLKGLIIPEHSDSGEENTSIDLPEIKSTELPVIPVAEVKSQQPTLKPSHSRNSSTPSFSLSNWNSEAASNTIPKYSPAFKRKSIVVYGTKTEVKKPISTSQVEDECRLPVTSSLSDAPKSLESITSPTRSDCSFEYVASSPELKAPVKLPCENKKSDTGKSEDESDNDSAVSSSQSSYISRTSPRMSPNHLQPHYTSRLELTPADQQSTDSLNRRLLKPQSVEAINRKNILASAKCRSGRDLKVGSPLIQRKFDEGKEAEAEAEAKAKAIQPEPPATETTKPVEVPPKSEILPATTPEEKPLKTPPVNSGVGEITKLTGSLSVIEKPKPIPTTRESFDISINRPLVPRSLSRNSRAASVNDLRKNFEKLTQAPTPITPPPASSVVKANNRMSLHVNNTQPAPPAPVAAKRNSLPNIQAPVAKPINTKDHQVALDETLQQYDETFKPEELKVIELCPEFLGSSIGITLAGGTDYETKEITVHKVRCGSVAFQDGRLKKGDRILSINGKTMKGVTHAQSIAILKEPVSQVILVACTWKEQSPSSTLTPNSRHNSSFDLTAVSPKVDAPTSGPVNNKQEDITVTLVKDAAGLGFSMEGGKDSAQGDVPLVIKKLFTGGTADKCGKLKVGDELVEINGVNVTQTPRIDTWNLMKKLPAGEVIIKVRR